MAATLKNEIADLRRAKAEVERRLDEALAERDEAQAQTAAMAEVLEVINDSPGDLDPVFNAILKKAHDLCGAETGVLLSYDGECYWPLAAHGTSAQFIERVRQGFRPGINNPFARVLRGERFVQIPDVAEFIEGVDDPELRIAVDMGIHTFVVVPLRKDDKILGAISANRRTVSPLTEKQIALLQSFATQAVIAIENARLITETRETLEKQTATAEILRVISKSPTDLQPTFDAIAARATTLCGAVSGAVFRFDGSLIHFAAHHGWDQEELQATQSAFPMPPGQDSITARAILDRKVAYSSNVSSDPSVQSILAQAFRTVLSVPMLRDGDALGAITVTRRQVEPFTNAQIDLLRTFANQAVIAIENVRLFTELGDALEQQTATAEVLGIINSSPGDLAPVFDAMLDRAMRLCEASFGHLATYDGERFHTAAIRGVPAPFAEFRRQSPQVYGQGTGVARLLAGERVVHFTDVAETEAYRAGDPNQRAVVDLGGARTMLVVPLLKDEAVRGFITVYRQEVRPFTDKQIALLQNFAAQTVIAMENARLLDELRQRTEDLQESLEYQTATSDVLQTISRSAFDLQAVLNTLSETAARLCAAELGFMTRRDGDAYRFVTAVGSTPETAADALRLKETVLDRQSFVAGRGSITGRVISEAKTVQIDDLASDSEYTLNELITVGKIRTLLGVPLMREDAVIGTMSLGRQRAEPFTERQIELVQTFADQAVIALENARLIGETREALEQQTATAEVLGVINSSPGDLKPVFDAMLEKAFRLCDGVQGSMWTFEGDRPRLAVARGISDEFIKVLREEWERRGPSEHHPMSRLRLGERVVQILDISASDLYQAGDPAAVAAVELGQVRTLMFVALVKDAAPLGAFIIARREVRAFSEKQIALVQNFAAQAVIAMENARLITETHEALEQQTATAEVLQVINSSPGDLSPVFDAILEKAHDLCGVSNGALEVWDGERIRALATRGLPTSFEIMVREGYRPSENDPHWELLNGAAFVHIPDQAAIDEPAHRKAVEVGGFRTFLAVALRKDDKLLGRIVAARQEVRPFADKEIALLKNFAAQAVIAIENARLLNETREALEQQTATAEVLQVINSSPGNLQPIFDAILEKAHSLCGVAYGSLQLYDGEKFRAVAVHGLPEALADRLRQGYVPGPRMQGLLDRTPFDHIHDMAEIDDPMARSVVELSGLRTLLRVALRKDDTLLGQIVAARLEVRPFSEKEIALLQNFAAQAVIAIENARLLTEQREALEQQTATAEVLEVINSSPGDLAPVFEAMLEKATRVCAAHAGVLCTYDGARFWPVAHRGFPDFPREPIRAHPEIGIGRIERGEDIVHILDSASGEAYTSGNLARRAIVELGGARSQLTAALRKEGVLLGAFTIWRKEVRPFSGKEIALLQNFAAQAVIAIENTRLITETREALEQQTATAEVLQVINSSPGDLAPVFDAILEKAHTLCGATHGALGTYDGDRYFRSVAERGYPELVAERLRQGFDGLTNPVTRPLIDGERFVHIPDLAEIDHPIPQTVARLGGFHTGLFLPLRKDGRLLGHISVARAEIRPFADKEILLLENFAAQAVIAMENARLITETRESLEQQQAIAEILQVINSSPGELQPVFDILLQKAMQLCGAAFGVLAVLDGEQTQTVAAQGLPPALAEWRRNHPVISPRNTLLARVLTGEAYVHTLDLKDDDLYRQGEALRRANVDLGGARTSLYVPLLRDRDVLGTIHIYRQEVRPFSDKQIALLQNFAAQAVVAMENARLLGEIRQRQQELRVTFDNMGDGVAMFDSDLQLAAWNRNFQELLQLSDDYLAEPHGFDDYIRSLTARGEFGETDAETQIKRLRARLGEHYSFERTRPDGTVIEIRNNPMPDGGVVVIYSDITERKRSEEEVRAARDAAEAALRDLRAAQSSLIQAQKMAALGQLTAGIAHEIKNPLNFVNNFAGLSVELLDELKEATAPLVAALHESERAEIDETIEMLTGNLDKITEHGQRADNIVKSMLEHSRGVSGERREIDLNNLIDEALNLAYHGARALDREFNIGLEHDYALMLKPIEVVPQEITRVFLNLFANGFYAAHKRVSEIGNASFQPLLRVTTREFGHAVEVRIRDNGIGIPDDIKDKLFQPFFTTKPTGEGTGLGLSISYDIVTQQHGGTIEVESEVGEFTEFTVRLPRTYRATAETAS